MQPTAGQAATYRALVQPGVDAWKREGQAIPRGLFDEAKPRLPTPEYRHSAAQRSYSWARYLEAGSLAPDRHTFVHRPSTFVSTHGAAQLPLNLLHQPTTLSSSQHLTHFPSNRPPPLTRYTKYLDNCHDKACCFAPLRHPTHRPVYFFFLAAR